MADCVDTNDLTTQNALALAVGSSTNSRGEFTLNQIDRFAQDLTNNIARDAERNPISRLVNLYGDSFYDSLNNLNNQFRTRADVQNTLGDYPDLQNRWSKGSISALEYADFVTSYNFTPDGVTGKGRTNYPGLLFDLNNYYQKSFSTSVLGGFCALVPQVFGAIDAFFTIVGQIEGAINNAVSFLNKIRSYDGITDFIQKEVIEGLIKEIRNKIVQTISGVFEEVKSAINNFDIEGIIGQVDTFVRQNVVKRIMTTKEQMCVFFTEKNKKSLENKAKGLIDYAVSLFESPDLEAIQFLIARFCAFAANIEALIKDIKSPLDNYAFKYRRIANRLKTISNINTSTAIRAGAIRLSDDVKREGINIIQSQWTGEGSGKAMTPTGNAPVNVPLPSISEYANLPKCGAVFEGTDTRVKLSGDWVEDLGLEGWTKIDLDVKVYLMRVQKEINTRFNVTAGWRSEQYNKSIGASPESPHLSGLVLDVAIEGFDADEFANSALKNGFKFVKIYPTHIHLDVRQRPQL